LARLSPSWKHLQVNTAALRIFAILVGISIAFSAFGQGTVNFANHPDIWMDGIDRRVYFDLVGGAGVVGTNYVAQLWYGPDASSISSFAPRLAPFRPTDAPPPGVWLGGVRTLDGFGPGQTATLQVKVWDITLFSTYEQASRTSGAIFGASQPFQYMVPPVGSVEGFTLDNLRAFALVPEPSVIVLSAFAVFVFSAMRVREGSKTHGREHTSSTRTLS
jgi:hypothetical protein